MKFWGSSYFSITTLSILFHYLLASTLKLRNLLSTYNCCSFESNLISFSFFFFFFLISQSLVLCSFIRMCLSCGFPIYLYCLRFVGLPESVGYCLINFRTFLAVISSSPSFSISSLGNLIRCLLYILSLPSASFNVLFYIFIFFFLSELFLQISILSCI